MVWSVKLITALGYTSSLIVLYCTSETTNYSSVSMRDHNCALNFKHTVAFSNGIEWNRIFLMCTSYVQLIVRPLFLELCKSVQISEFVWII